MIFGFSKHLLRSIVSGSDRFRAMMLLKLVLAETFIAGPHRPFPLPPRPPAVSSVPGVIEAPFQTSATVGSAPGSPGTAATWADAVWAIRFYEKHGFRLVTPEEKDRLLRRYWSIPDRHVETSVVLAGPEWQTTREG